MKTFEEFNKEIRRNIIEQWTKSGHSVAGMENDPVINLLLSAMSFQAYHLQKNINQFEEKTIREFLNRSVPFHLIKPIPAFSIIETGLKAGCNEKMMDETCTFEFVNHKKQKLSFAPLLNTKVINAKLSMNEQIKENVWLIELQSAEPMESLSGLSFYIDTPELIEIESIKYNNKELPLIKPTQYSELPFTEWFSNAHLFLEQNYYLFGTYDYWKELFLTHTTNLYYIGQYGKEISTKGETHIKLEITFNSPVSSSEILKINCVPIVNVEKKEVTLDERNPVKDLATETAEFLNFLCDKNCEKDLAHVLIRQYGVERYNSEQLLEQMQEMLYRYYADYYAFQNIKELSATDKLETLKALMDDFRGIVSKAEDKIINEHFFAVLKKNDSEIVKAHLKYLTTAGAAGNEIKPFSKPVKSPVVCDSNKTSLLMETKGGRNSIKDEIQKETIAKYYFQTKDRLVTPADITLFIKSFYFNERILGNEIENISINREKDFIQISIKLKNESELQELENFNSLAETLQNKITLRSSGILPFVVNIT
jgi:hypothetical protein